MGLNTNYWQYKKKLLAFNFSGSIRGHSRAWTRRLKLIFPWLTCSVCTSSNLDRLLWKEKVTETSFFSLSIQGFIYHILYSLWLNIIPFYLKLIFCLDIIYYFWSGIHLSPWTFLKCFDSWVSLKFSHVKYPPKWTNRKFCETLSGYVWWVISINIKG